MANYKVNLVSLSVHKSALKNEHQNNLFNLELINSNELKADRYCRLYERLKRKKANSDESAFVLEQYVKLWQCWCTAGLGITSLIYVEKVLDPQVLSP
jgi:ribonuclease HIII